MGTPSHVEEAPARARPPAATGELGGQAPPAEGETDTAIAQRLRSEVDSLTSKADELEQKVKEVSYFFANKKQSNSFNGSPAAYKIDGSRKEVCCSRRMQEVMRQFGTILKQARADLSQHKWAWPFMDPVDVEGLGLQDYYEIIKKPMDFTTIRKQMDANKYKNVREIYADVRLVFSNAMTYNDDTESDVHVMAKTLLEKFEEKWLQFLPKVIEAEAKQKEEEEAALATMHTSQEAAIAKLARDTNNELNKLNLRLEELRELVIQRCRKMSLDEKRKLSAGLTSLSPDYLYEAVQIVAQGNPNYHSPDDVVEIDIDSQNEITLWRLKFFVKGALERQAKSEREARDSEIKTRNQTMEASDISKRKRSIYDALVISARKRSRRT